MFVALTRPSSLTVFLSARPYAIPYYILVHCIRCKSTVAVSKVPHWFHVYGPAAEHTASIIQDSSNVQSRRIESSRNRKIFKEKFHSRRYSCSVIYQIYSPLSLVEARLTKRSSSFFYAIIICALQTSVDYHM